MPPIVLTGAQNVRDVGGLPAGPGTTRTGILLRGDALDALTEADVEQLVDTIGVRHVIDLRSPAERRERGRGLLGATAVRYSDLDVIDEQVLARRSEQRKVAFAAGTDPVRIIADGYDELADLGAQAFVSAIETLVAPDGVPALVHCAIGKDRTGVLVALLLDAAGVDREAIVADYGLSHDSVQAVRARLADSPAFEALAEQVPAFVFEARPATMALFLGHLDEHWGGGRGYFRAHGVDDTLLDRWRDTLIAR
jgi:protein tyrosine/serine phosphatase